MNVNALQNYTLCVLCNKLDESSPQVQTTSTMEKLINSQKMLLEHLSLEGREYRCFWHINLRTNMVGRSGNFYSGRRSNIHHMSQLNCNKTIAFKSWWCNRKTRKHLDLSSSRLLGWIHYIYIVLVHYVFLSWTIFIPEEIILFN